MRFFGYYFHINTNIKKDFQICISVPLMLICLFKTIFGKFIVKERVLSFNLLDIVGS